MYKLSSRNPLFDISYKYMLGQHNRKHDSKLNLMALSTFMGILQNAKCKKNLDLLRIKQKINQVKGSTVRKKLQVFSPKF